MSDGMIFNCVDYQDFMAEAGRRALAEQGKPDTLENWARWLGYKSPRSIAMIFKGQRLPTQDMVERFSSRINLNESEHRCLELLVRLERVKRAGGDIEEVVSALEKIHPDKTFARQLSRSEFSPISEWYYLVLRQLVRLGSFRENAKWISEKLRRKISPQQAQEGVNTLLEHGSLGRDERTKALVCRQSVTTSVDLPSQAIRRHHRQMAQRGIDALLEQPVHEREFCTATMCMKSDDIDEAKEMIRSFRDRFHRRFACEKGGDQVMQMNIHFFSHTAEDS